MRRRPAAGRGVALEWIQSVITENPAECRIWPFARDSKGYGSVRFRGRNLPAHAVTLELSGRTKPPGLVYAAHAPVVCHEPLCCTPRHLRWATPAENCADTALDGTKNWGERCGSNRLTPAQVQEIRARAANGERPGPLADEFGVGRSTVRAVVSGSTWSWLDQERTDEQIRRFMAGLGWGAS